MLDIPHLTRRDAGLIWPLLPNPEFCLRKDRSVRPRSSSTIIHEKLKKRKSISSQVHHLSDCLDSIFRYSRLWRTARQRREKQILNECATKTLGYVVLPPNQSLD